MLDEIKKQIPFEISSIVPIKKGGNSKVYKILSQKEEYALKIYPKNDKRQRFEKETSAFEFLADNSIREIPKTILKNQEYGFVVFEWLEGQVIKSPKDKDIKALADFFIGLQKTKNKAFGKMSNAADACFSKKMLQDYFLRRISNFDDCHEIKSFIKDINQEYEKRVLQMRNLPNKHLDKKFWVLSASDYGFHNAIKTKNGFKFFDFEYFGFDDPIKAISDVLLHPAMSLKKQHRDLYYEKTIPFLKEQDKEIVQRFNSFFPIFGLIWCLIVLNIYLPYYRDMRKAFQTKETQLEKAIKLYERIKKDEI